MQNTLEQLQPTPSDPIGNIADGFGKMQNWDQFGGMGASMAQAGMGAKQSRQQHEALEREKAMTAYSTVKKDTDDQQKMMMDAGKLADEKKRLAANQKGFEFRTLGDKTVAIFDKATAHPVGVFGPKDISKLMETSKAIAMKAVEAGQFSTMNEALDFGMQEAIRILNASNSAQGNVAPEDIQPPPAAEVPPPPLGIEAQPTSDTEVKLDTANWSQTDKDLARRVIGRFQANPNEGTRRAMEQELAAIVAKYPGSAGTSPPDQRQVMPKKDERSTAFKKQFGEKEAATLEKALTSSNEVYSNNSQLMSTLNHLGGLLAMDDVPEGKMANWIVDMESGLSTFGIKLGGATGPAQAAAALGNEMALKMRTAGDSNLMPGQMSNFDAQLLQSMVPNLSQTKEGRAILVDTMKDMAKSRMMIAEEAQKFAQDNGGMLTPEWRAKAAELEKREMVRREITRRKLMKKFGGAK
jgi:hypothetical protein